MVVSAVLARKLSRRSETQPCNKMLSMFYSYCSIYKIALRGNDASIEFDFNGAKIREPN